jgi:hypothetical protein
LKPASERSAARARSSHQQVLGAAGLAAAILLLAWIWPLTAAAHGGGPALILEPDRVNPGGVLTVRGEDLGADEPIAFKIVGSAGTLDVGDMTADPVGHLTVALRVPPEMPVGVYALEAYQASGIRVANAPVFVEGAPILEGEGGPGGKDEDDGLLIALPAGWQQSLSSPIVTAVPVTSVGDGQTAAASELGLLAGLVVLALGAGAVGLVLASRLRRRGTPSAEPPSA